MEISKAELDNLLLKEWHKGYSKGRREKLGKCSWCGKQLAYDGNMHPQCAQTKNKLKPV